MTHAEAAALYPIREPFGASDRPVAEWGRAFSDAKARAAALGLARVENGEGPGHGEADGPDGVILPGHSDDDPPVPRIARWLGAVTLYCRARRGVACG